MVAENPLPETSRTGRGFVWIIGGVLCGFILAIFLGALYRTSTSGSGAYTLEYDNNADGRPDVSYHYQKGVVAKSEHDRNFDGRFDHFEWYEDGILARAVSDDDFDGAIDGWLTFEEGNLWFSKHDTDKNGTSDVFQHFEHGVIGIAVWRPNETQKAIRVEYFEKAVKTKELRDTDGDGLLETEVLFDAFENQTASKRLETPISSQQAIAEVRNLLSPKQAAYVQRGATN